MLETIILYFVLITYYYNSLPNNRVEITNITVLNEQYLIFFVQKEREVEKKKEILIQILETSPIEKLSWCPRSL